LPAPGYVRYCHRYSSSRIQSAVHIAVIPYNDQYRHTGFIKKSLEGDQCP
jgi:hypothetical protein